MPHLFSNRLRLRAPERDDIPQFLKWINDPDITEDLMLYQPISAEEEANWYENMLKRPAAEHVMVIEIKAPVEGKSETETWFPIGNIQFLDIDWRNRKTEIGIMIGEKEYWDQGYGSEAMQLMLKHGFKNVRGIRAYEKTGFTVESRFREAHYQHGRYYDIIIMSILRSEWEAIQK